MNILEIKGQALRALDALSTAPLARGSDSPTELIARIANPNEGKSARIRAASHLADWFIPGLEKAVASFLFKPEMFPFGDNDINIVGYGSAQTVSKFEANNQQWAIKIDRRSLGFDEQRLRARAQQLRGEYDLVREWFVGVDRLLPPEHYLIVHSHIRRIPAVATVQPFIPYIRGFFEDFDRREIVGLIRKDRQLREQFVPFAERLVERWYTDGDQLCLDFGGDRNLVVVPVEDHNELVVLDPHFLYDKGRFARNTDFTRQKITNRVEQIVDTLLEVA